MHISVPNIWDGNDRCKYTTMSSYDNKTQSENRTTDMNATHQMYLWGFKKTNKQTNKVLFVLFFCSHSPKKTHFVFFESEKNVNICCIIKC